MKNKKIDTFSYKGNMNSDFFLKRAFAVLGHNIAAYLIILIPIYILIFVLAFALFAVSDMHDRVGQDESGTVASSTLR